MKYRPEINGLRAVAVVPVVFFHAGLDAFAGGFVGVDVFFVISGYLITSIILEDLDAGRFSLVSFYERRARRILPALFFVVFCCFPMAWAWMLPAQTIDFAESVISVVLYVSNFLFWLETDYFAALAEEKPLLHTWSLAVEEQFYLLFPLFLLMFFRSGWRRLAVIVAGLSTLSFLLAQFGGNLRPESPFVEPKLLLTAVPNHAFFLAPTRAWELLVGALVAIYLRDRGERSGSQLLALGGLGLVVYAVVDFDGGTPFPSYYALAPVIGTAMLIIWATPSTWVARSLSLRPLVGMGLISYSVYLWHQPLYAFARVSTPGKVEARTFVVLAAVSVVLGALSWRFVERPFRNRGGFSRKQIFGLAAACSVGAIVASLGAIKTEGLYFRFADQDRALLTLDPKVQGAYVRTLFNLHRGKSFTEDAPRYKVLVIGDSFAQDFVNTLAETGLLAGAELSTHHISARCGVVWSGRDFMQRIAENMRAQCIRRGWFSEHRLQENLKRANLVIIISSWKAWQIEFVEETLANVEAATDAPVFVVGRKQYPKVNVAEALKMSHPERAEFTGRVASGAVKVNRRMRETLPPEQFFDLHSLVCGLDANSCRQFTPNADLISHDGAHLTQAGAAFLGQKLTELEHFRTLWPGRKE